MIDPTETSFYEAQPAAPSDGISAEVEQVSEQVPTTRWRPSCCALMGEVCRPRRWLFPGDGPNKSPGPSTGYRRLPAELSAPAKGGASLAVYRRPRAIAGQLEDLSSSMALTESARQCGAADAYRAVVG